jgi:preprotein translocase subunit SecF
MRILNTFNIDFIGKRYVNFAFTGILLVLSTLVFIKEKGPILSIEFTGGTMVEMKFNQLPSLAEIRKSLGSQGWGEVGLQTQPSDNTLLIKVKTGEKATQDISASLTEALKHDFAGNVHDRPERVEFIGSVIGKSIIVNTAWALLGSMGLIIIYVAIRFKNWIWGFSGVFALMHDVYITWALLTFLKAETTLVVIAALLTLAGYSINDTIVIFDRVRENIRTSRKEDLKTLYNRSINETLSRTINTSMTVFLASISLLLFGGHVLRDFSIAFSFGVLIGTYSSVGVALSTVYEMEKRRGKH